MMFGKLEFQVRTGLIETPKRIIKGSYIRFDSQQIVCCNKSGKIMGKSEEKAPLRFSLQSLE